MNVFLKNHRVSLIFFLTFITSVAHATESMKIGFVYVGPIGDHGWTYQHESGTVSD